MMLSRLAAAILFVFFMACHFDVVSQNARRATVRGQVERIGHVSRTDDDVIHYSLHVRQNGILYVGHITPAKALSFLGKRVKRYGDLNHIVGQQVAMTIVEDASGVSGNDNYVMGPVVRLTLNPPPAPKQSPDTKPAATVKRFIKALDAGDITEAMALCSERFLSLQANREVAFGKLSRAIKERQGVKLIEILEQVLITNRGNPFHQLVARVTYQDRNVAYARFRIIEQGSGYAVSFWESGMRPGATVRFPT